MKTRITLLSAALLISAGLFAQGSVIKKAHKLYDNMAYAKAIEMYEYAVQKDVKDAMVFRNLADSYEKVRSFDKASQYYGELVAMDGAKAMDYYNYAQNLKTTGDYSASKKWMEKYASMSTGDVRAEKHKKAGDYEDILKEDMDRFTVFPLNVNTSGMDWGPTVLGNKIVFASNRKKTASTLREHSWDGKNFLDLYEGEIMEDGRVKNVTMLNGRVNSKYHEGGACFTPDGKTIWFTRNNYYEKKVGKTSQDVINLKMYSTTKDQNGDWSNELNFPFNSNEYSVGHPSLTMDGKTMYFTSDMPGGMGGKDIYKTTMDASGEWGQPINLGGEINTKGDEMFPYIAMDGTLYFASNGHVGLGGLDIFSAWKSSGQWGAVENLGYPVNSSWDDFGIVLRNETEGYFSSNRSGGQGSDDIYKFTMAPKAKLAVEGIVVNKEGMVPLKGARAILVDEKGNKLEETVVGEDGKFRFDLDPELCNYKVMIDNGDGWTTTQTKNTPCDPEDQLIDEGRIVLEEMKYGAQGIVRNADTNEPVDGFLVTLMDSQGNKISEKTTVNGGNIEFPLMPETDYKVRFEKDGFLAKNGQFTTQGMKPGILSMNKYVDLTFETVEVGKTFEIDNIYFDLNKDNIRPDAAVELDKIVKVMQDNPTMVIELGSHTDARGSDKYNESLSDRRAKSSAAYIVSKGIASDRITGKGYGEAQLKNKCANGVRCSEEEHQQNRRTEFKIIKF